MWRCKKCNGKIVEEPQFTFTGLNDKKFNQEDIVSVGGCEKMYNDCDKLYVCTHCGANHLNDINKLAEWED